MEIDLKQLRELMRALSEHDVSELEIERGDERIVLRRGAAVVTAPAMAAFSATGLPPPASFPADRALAAPAPAVAAAESDPNVVHVTSPFVGTFYKSPSPGAKPFVDIGQQVAPGQVLCIVEAMKLMNEIEAEFACTILEVLVDNGKPVEYGDPLYRVRKA
jgi:acetyl-CoA carboxylase biotin carboxyl carrier protein